MMLFRPGDRVIHDDYGIGTMVRTSTIYAKVEMIETQLYVVNFDNGGFVTFSEGAAFQELGEIVNNDEDCQFCDFHLQGNPIPPEDQYLYGATHFSLSLRIIDDGRTVAYQCPKCRTISSAFTGEKIKRLAPFWTKYGMMYPQPISEFGPLHLWNIKKFRRGRMPWLKGDDMDVALTHEIRRYWPLFPLLVVLAPISKAYHDRKIRKETKLIEQVFQEFIS